MYKTRHVDGHAMVISLSGTGDKGAAGVTVSFSISWEHGCVHEKHFSMVSEMVAAWISCQVNIRCWRSACRRA